MRSTHSARVDQVVGGLQGIRYGHHDLRLLLLKVELWLLRLSSSERGLVPLLLLRLPSPLRLFSRLFLPSRFQGRHVLLASLLAFTSLQFSLTLFQCDTSLALQSALVCIGFRRGQVGVGIGPALTWFPVMAEERIVIGKATATGAFGSGGGRTVATATSSGYRAGLVT